jgi:GntR family L-lactate dehydrogenase operon transcriptional regulator
LAARADAQFHLAIAEASHNLVLVQVMRSLFTTVLSTVARNRHDMFHLSAPVTVQALTEQHQALMQAILDGDPQRARQCIDEHLEHVRVTIQRWTKTAHGRNVPHACRRIWPPLLPETSPHT